MLRTLSLTIVMLGFYVILVALSTVNCIIVDNWEVYKRLYNKSYLSHEEAKKDAWHVNLKKVIRHNAEAIVGLHSYTLKTNILADLTHSDYLKMTNLRVEPLDVNRRVTRRNKKEPLLRSLRLPKEFDWRKKGFVTPHWSQGSCGSCYAFSVAASLQAQIFIKEKKKKELSIQQIVDCSIVTGNFGCAGGSFKNTLRYLQLHGLMGEKDYPYEAKQSICRYKPLKVTAKLKSWDFLPSGDEEALKEAVATVGPIPVAINASPDTFQLYDSGIYNDPKCPNNTLNHAMLLVGYTDKAWIVKNWWTEKWGQNGYMYVKRGKNRCGIANLAVYIKG